MKRDEAEQIVRAFADLRIMVFGDLMLDRYVTGSVQRISPEAPVPVLRVTHEQARPGGAANVAFNICTLGARAVICGLAGKDKAGEELLALLAGEGVDTAGVAALDNLTTTVKTRVLAERQQIVRVDREESRGYGEDAIRALNKAALEALPGSHGLIVEDYGKGTVRQDSVDTIIHEAVRQKILTGYDPKESHHLQFPALTVATPNYMESCDAAGIPQRELGDELTNDPHLRDVASVLIDKWNCEILLMTLGAKGVYLAGPSREPVHIHTRAKEVFDVSGAGDTVIAVTMLALAAGADRSSAVSLANAAAGVVVGKVGTAPCYAEELLTALTED